jgi:serine/threonine protein kinase
VLQLGLDLATALHYLHEELFEDAMVIHRDLKVPI